MNMNIQTKPIAFITKILAKINIFGKAMNKKKITLQKIASEDKR